MTEFNGAVWLVGGHARGFLLERAAGRPICHPKSRDAIPASTCLCPATMG